MQDQRPFMPPPPPKELRKDFNPNEKPAFSEPPKSSAPQSVSTSQAQPASVSSASSAQPTRPTSSVSSIKQESAVQAQNMTSYGTALPPRQPFPSQQGQTASAQPDFLSVSETKQTVPNSLNESAVKDDRTESDTKAKTLNKNAIINWFGLCISAIAFVLCLLFIIRS